MSYKHLSLEERHYIEIEMRKGTKKEEIAVSLNRDVSTIYREINRNTGLRGYRHKQASRKACERHKNKEKRVKMTDELKTEIGGLIRKDWSPEQISGWLLKKKKTSVHHETIYQYILDDKKAGGDLYKHLRHQGKTYRKRYGSANNRTGIPNRVDIDERPTAANNRERVGDIEIDTIIGKNHKGAIVTMDDRKTKLRFAAPLPGKKAEVLSDMVIKLLDPFKEFVHTITYDNGKEFALHERIAKAIGCNNYFAKPYHSWERGQNENANGLLRQYFPKSMELVDVTMEQVYKAIDKLNRRPRKCLGFRTPYEIFEELTGVNAKKLIKFALMT